MGWNSGFTIMENTVVTLYDNGVLTKDLLDKIMNPFKGTDCDSGGSRGLVSNDGKCVEHIICEIMKPEETKNVVENPKWDCPYEEIPTNYEGYSDPYWKANENAYDLFYAIWRDMWGMW